MTLPRSPGIHAGEVHDDPERVGGRYTWEDFERGVDEGIRHALHRATVARKRRPAAKPKAAPRTRR